MIALVSLWTRTYAWLSKLLAPLLMPALLALLALCAGGWAWQTVRIDGFHLWFVKIDGLRKERDDALAALDAVKKAQPIAAAAQAAANHAPAAASAQIAEKSDVDADAYYAQGRAAGLAYAAAHRVPASCPASQPSGASVPGSDHAAAVDDGPGEAADMVAISRPNFNLCGANSQRLAKVHQDAQALIDAGAAVASDKP